jgi:type VI secretion system secreted protein VgrG
VPEIGDLRYIDIGASAHRDCQHLSEWTPLRRFRTGKIALNDYDYMKPAQSLLVNKAAQSKYKHGLLEHYDHHLQYDKTSNGERFAQVKLDMTQSLDQRRMARGDAASLFPGGLVKMIEHGAKAENVEYLVVSCEHDLGGESYRGGSGATGDYRGNYELQPATRPFRPPQVTPKPSVHGVQTAKVVGAEGEEIDVDEHGRILVQFHWDREKKASRRVRVSQLWAHKNWGALFIPRIGMEVIVEFVEGDPDHPLVTGCVYNGQNTPPSALPEKKMRAGIKSMSTKGGSDETANYIVFDDKKDDEGLRIWAEKDFMQHAENKELVAIGQKFPHQRIRGDKQGASREVVIHNGDDDLDVKKGSQNINIAGSLTETVGGDEKETIKGKQTTDVTQNIKITAGTKIELICGGSKIVMDPGSIKITSGEITVDAPMTTVKGTATLTLKGGMVLIN